MKTAKVEDPQRRGVFLVRIAILLTIFTGLFAEGPFPLDNSRSTAASPFAACVAPCFENFDNVTAPALPSGWTTTRITIDPTWKTVNNVSDSASNSAFAGGPSHISDNRLVSRNVGIVSATSVLTFRRSNNLENGFDGMVLEISINGQNFEDIITAGGSFVNGGYNTTISLPSSSSPIAGRAAWTGDTGGFVTTTVNLPASANQKTVKFRWRVGTDTSIGSQGAFIDSINLTNFVEPPANDDFANAEPLPLGSSGVINGTTLGAAKEDAEENHAGNAGGTSVWYRWQAPETGRFVFTTFNSGFDTLLAVYTGDSFPLNPVVSNDNDPTELGSPCSGITTSTVAFPATAGVIYRIAVDRKSSNQFDSNNIKLRWGRSASISGRISTASGGMVGDTLSTIQLLGDTCRASGPPIFNFTDVPTGGSYSIFFSQMSRYVPWDPSKSISPLAGSVSDFNFYKTQPAANIAGTVRIPGNDFSGLTVRCVSTPIPLISKEAFLLGNGGYQCTALPADANYIVTPTKLGFNFDPPSRDVRINLAPDPTQSVFGGDFDGIALETRTISGRVATAGGTGISGVSMALSGSQTTSTVTDANGNYSFTNILQGGTYTVTPSNSNVTFIPANLSFSNVNADQTANFTGTFLLQLVLDELGQVAALESSLLMRDPFPVINNSNLLNTGIDRNTRVTIFLANFQLGAGETPSSVMINLVGSNNQSYDDIPAEAVRLATNPTFSQVTFKLPDSLAPGICTLKVKARGLTSNMGSMRIKP